MASPSCTLAGSPEEGQGQKWGFRGTEEREGWSLQCKPEEDGNKHIPHFLTILNPFSFLSQRAELTSDKDMYLDNSSIEDASGVYPIDDDDYASASGSGKAGVGTLASVLRAYTCAHTHVHTHAHTVSWLRQGDRQGAQGLRACSLCPNAWV